MPPSQLSPVVSSQPAPRRRPARLLRRLGSLLAGLLAVTSQAQSGDRNLGTHCVYPAAAFAQNGGRVLDVTQAPFSAVGDGVTDDTAALIRAYDFVADKIRQYGIHDARASFIIYLPAGTYLVSDTILYSPPFVDYFESHPGNEGMTSLRFVGESRESTVIRLRDNCPGFEAGSAKAVVRYAMTDFNNAETKSAFRNLTIDTGHGNPGAVGLDFNGANGVSISNTAVVAGDGQGFIGIQFRVPPTQGYHHDITVDGFDYGISSDPYHATQNSFEYVTLRHQRVAGFRALQSGVSIRRLRSENTVPAFSQEMAGSQLIVLDSDLTGGTANAAAIRSLAGQLFVRDVRISGYGPAVDKEGTVLTDRTIGEYISGPVFSRASQASRKSMNLPVRDWPLADWPEASSQWANVNDYGAVGNGQTDDSAAIQAAMNSGRPVVYFPGRAYRVASPVTVPATVRRVHGLYTDFSGSSAVFRVVGAADEPPVLFEDATVATGVFCEHAGPRTVVIDSVAALGSLYNNTNTARTLLFVNASNGLGKNRRVINEEAYCRFINTERKDGANFTCDNAVLWVFGYKVESTFESFVAQNGACLEVLGGIANQTPFTSGKGTSKYPADATENIVRNAGANVSVMLHTNGQKNQPITFRTAVIDQQPGGTEELRLTSLPPRPGTAVASSPGNYKNEYFLPLYVSYDETAIPRAPAFAAAAITKGPAIVGAAYTGSLASDASDANGDNLTFAKLAGPVWLTLAADGALTGTPGAGDIGLNTFTVRVADPSGYSATAIVHLAVLALPSSDPYFLSDPLAVGAATVDAPYNGSLAGRAVAPVGGALIFTKLDGPAWLALAADGALSGTPSAGDSGSNAFTIRAADGSGRTATATLLLPVQPAVSPVPYFVTNPVVKPTATAGLAYSASLAGDAIDPNGDALTFEKTGGPAWLEVAANGTLLGTPASGDVGANSFTVRATDPAGHAALATLQITVEPDPSQGLPVTVTLLSIGAEDGYVTESTPGSGVGGGSASGASGNAGIRIGDSASNQQVKGLLSFDTSVLPANATIDSVVLRLKRGQISGTDPFTISGWACRVDLCSANGGFGGNSNLQVADFQAAPTYANVATLGHALANGDWAEASITNPTHLAAVSRTGRTQFRFAFTIGTNGNGVQDHMGFWPGEATQAGNEPQLVVTYHVNKTHAAVTLGNLTQVYDAASKTATVTTAPAGLATTLTYDGGTTPPTDAGSYAIVAIIDDPSYYGSATGTLVVNPAPAAITLGQLNQTYDGFPKAVTVATVPAARPFTLTYNDSPDAPVNAGTYAVEATIDDPNYTGSATGTLVVSPAAATVTLGDLARTYDSAPKAATIVTVPAGLPVVVTYNGSLMPPTNAGSYAVDATVAHPNYTGGTTGTLTIAKAPAALAFGPLRQAYDGAPRTVATTTTPAGLPVTVTYDGAANVPLYPGEYAVHAVIDSLNYTGSADDTLIVAITALVRHAPTLNGEIDGSMQVLLPENITLNGNAGIFGDLLVPGVPTLRLNGQSTFGGMIDGPGAIAPTSHAVTLNGNALVRSLVRRIDPIAMPVAETPVSPTGTRGIVLNQPDQDPGDFATIRDLTLNGNAGLIAVPPGAYRNFTANGNSGFVLGLVGGTEPAVYDLRQLSLNGNARLQIAGPVRLRLAASLSLDTTVNSTGDPNWLRLEIPTGDVTLNGGSRLNGHVVAPAGSVILNGNATLTGSVACDRLLLNGGALLVQPASTP